MKIDKIVIGKHKINAYWKNKKVAEHLTVYTTCLADILKNHIAVGGYIDCVDFEKYCQYELAGGFVGAIKQAREKIEASDVIDAYDILGAVLTTKEA
jgi:hypothetical protein